MSILNSFVKLETLNSSTKESISIPLKTQSITWNALSLMVKSEVFMNAGRATNRTSIDSTGSRDPLITINTAHSNRLVSFCDRIDKTKEKIRITANIQDQEGVSWSAKADCILKENPVKQGIGIDYEMNFVITDDF